MTIKDLDKFVGIPFKPEGTDENGVDCVTLIGFYFKELGIDLKIPNYKFNGVFDLTKKKEYNDKILEYIKNKKLILRVEDLKEHDLLCFGIHSKSIDLLGIFLKESKFLHMPHEGGSVISRFGKRWKSKFKLGVRLING